MNQEAIYKAFLCGISFYIVKCGYLCSIYYCVCVWRFPLTLSRRTVAVSFAGGGVEEFTFALFVGNVSKPGQLSRA